MACFYGGPEVQITTAKKKSQKSNQQTRNHNQKVENADWTDTLSVFLIGMRDAIILGPSAATNTLLKLRNQRVALEMSVLF